MELCAALPDDDVAGCRLRAAADFDAQHLGVGILAVLRAATRLLGRAAGVTRDSLLATRPWWAGRLQRLHIAGSPVAQQHDAQQPIAPSVLHARRRSGNEGCLCGTSKLCVDKIASESASRVEGHCQSNQVLPFEDIEVHGNRRSKQQEMMLAVSVCIDAPLNAGTSAGSRWLT